MKFASLSLNDPLTLYLEPILTVSYPLLLTLWKTTKDMLDKFTCNTISRVNEFVFVQDSAVILFFSLQ